jgi:predicted nuclease of predicted toxin-antitoxin system
MAGPPATHRVNQPSPARLLLDEMFSPVIAAALRDLGHDVAAVAEQPALRAMTDEEVFALAAAQGQWLLTENVKDFQPILQLSRQAGTPAAALLFTSSRAFPRSRKNPGPLVDAIHAWLTAGTPRPPLCEDWLLNPDD